MVNSIQQFCSEGVKKLKKAPEPKNSGASAIHYLVVVPVSRN